jgi:chloramphenicol 3-O-phosphotransferase
MAEYAVDCATLRQSWSITLSTVRCSARDKTEYHLRPSAPRLGGRAGGFGSWAARDAFRSSTS